MATSLSRGEAGGAAAGDHDLLVAALTYAERGWKVFPVKRDKTPWTANGFKDATGDPDLIRHMWQEHPAAGIGIATGAVSGIVVLDEDTPKGGARGRLELEKRIGALPATYEVLTGSGGKHYYYLHPGIVVPCSAAKLATGVDVRGDGGYVCAPPSMHASGRPYKVLHARELVPWPSALLNGAASENRNGAAPVGDVIPEGRRDVTLASLAGSMRRRGMSERAILEALKVENETRCKPPLPARDVARIARSIASKSPEVAATGIEWERLSGVEMRSIVFADKPLLQADAFHLITGRKGMGKGTLLALNASRVTRGDLGERRNVVWIASEDSAAIDLKPRIVAADGDPERVLVVKSGWIQLPRDIDEIGRAMTELGDVGMLVIDPVGNHISGKNSNSETDIRDAIAPLNRIADEHHCMAFGVRHLSEKECSHGVLAAILGSSAWVQVPRAVLAVVRDNETPDIGHVQCVAGNRLPPGTPGRMFRIEGVTLPGLENEVTRAVWIGDSMKDVEAMLGTRPRGSKTADARELILDILDADGEQESDALDARVARETGLATKTIRNIRVDLKDAGLVRAIPSKDEDGQVERWMVTRTLAPRTDEG